MSKQKTIKEIEKALPGIKSEKVSDIADTLDRILAIKRLFQSDDGKELLSSLKDSASISLRKAILAAKRGETNELMAHILDYSAISELMSRVQDISLEKELREQLDEAVKEAYV